jgi:hypothetical protein
MQVCFKVFRSDRFESRVGLYKKVAEFASLVGPERLINISHSDGDTGRVAVVWYWYKPETGGDEPGVVTFEMDPAEEIVAFEIDPEFKHDAKPHS